VKEIEGGYRSALDFLLMNSLTVLLEGEERTKKNRKPPALTAKIGKKGASRRRDCE